MRSPWLIASLVALIGAVFVCQSATAQDSSVAAEIKLQEAAFSKAFDAGKANEVVAHFSPTAEYIDEEGNLYRGTKELTELFTKFFEKYPGSKLAMEIE